MKSDGDGRFGVFQGCWKVGGDTGDSGDTRSHRTQSERDRTMSMWKSIWHEGRWLYDLGVCPDGTLHNPKGYPDDIVRAAVAAADERRRARRSEAAQKAATTRRRRHDKKVHEIAKLIHMGQLLGPRRTCFLCERTLMDSASINRGIGPECWEVVLGDAEFISDRVGADRVVPTP
jgi:hypothetical protein